MPNTEVISRYIREQEAEDERLDQLELPINKRRTKHKNKSRLERLNFEASGIAGGSSL